MTWREDKALLTLGFFTIFFALIVLLISFLRPNDGVLFQTYVGMLTGFGGAILLHLKTGTAPPPGTTTVTQVDQVTKTPPDPITP